MLAVNAGDSARFRFGAGSDDPTVISTCYHIQDQCGKGGRRTLDAQQRQIALGIRDAALGMVARTNLVGFCLAGMKILPLRRLSLVPAETEPETGIEIATVP